jgi:tartrate-resistant acid phosphatase type 5
LQDALPPRSLGGIKWRIPFCHHPPFCAGPFHGNTDRMESLVALFEAAGVKACFSGHEHNFQHSHWNGIDYFISGGGSKIRTGVPDRMEEAHTVSWAPVCHFLLVTIAGDRMTVRAIGESADRLVDIERFGVHSEPLSGPIVLP